MDQMNNKKGFGFLGDSVRIAGGSVQIINKNIIKEKIHELAELAALGKGTEKSLAQYIIRLTALEFGILPSSIHELYMARGREEVPFTFVVPAMNLRILPFHSARMIFRQANHLDASAFIFEIARSEMGYTDQSPSEYSAEILAAAIAEGFHGPVFIQGDHFQVSAKKYSEDKESEIRSLQNLIVDAINAGFFNIDIDTSTMVDLTKQDINDQQKNNIFLTELFCRYIRQHQPTGITISVGGEIGEVGGHNSTEAELHAYLDGFNKRREMEKPVISGLSKVSVQTGTSHGGVVLPDGSIAKVKVDFNTLKDLSRVARHHYGLGGTVQHGASTLPEEAFDKFIGSEAIEIHLATNFANIFFDMIPATLQGEMYRAIDAKFGGERKSDLTDDQFYYKMRKYVIGEFKQQIWDLEEDVIERLQIAWEDKFLRLFHSLGVKGTREWTSKYIHPLVVQPHMKGPSSTSSGGTEAGQLAD
jgi:fructose/tagatose bisphosphate aldolase